MNQTGVVSTGWRRHARKNLSFTGEVEKNGRKSGFRCREFPLLCYYITVSRADGVHEIQYSLQFVLESATLTRVTVVVCPLEGM